MLDRLSPQHPRQTLSTMARAFRSALRTESGVRDMRAPARSLALAVSVLGRPLRVAVRLRRGVRAIREGGLMGLVRTFGAEILGANVEGVALGFKTFGVEMAEGAALGLRALGLTDDAAALGPVAAGAEPGDGIKTPWPKAGPTKMRGAQADNTANKSRRISGMAPSQGAV